MHEIEIPQEQYWAYSLTITEKGREKGSPEEYLTDTIKFFLNKHYAVK